MDERKTPSQTERGVTDNRSLANPTDDVSKVIRTQKPYKSNITEGEKYGRHNEYKRYELQKHL